VAVLEEHIIKVRHEVDRKTLEKIRKEAAANAKAIARDQAREAKAAAAEAASIAKKLEQEKAQATKAAAAEAAATVKKFEREKAQAAKTWTRVAIAAHKQKEREEKAAARETAAVVKKLERDKAADAKKTSEVWTGALRQVGARMVDFGIKSAKFAADYIADTFEGVRETDKFAKSLGIASSELMSLEKGFARARVPVSATRDAIQTLRENLGELERVGTGPAKDSLGSLGLTLEDFKNKTPTEQLKTFADALMNVEDPMKRTSIALEVLGDEAGRHVVAAMVDGAAGIDKLTQAARDAGQVLDEEAIEQTRKLDEKLLSLKGKAEGVALSIMEKAVPAFSEWAEKNDELIQQGVPAAIELIGTAAAGAAAFVLGLSAELGNLAGIGGEEGLRLKVLEEREASGRLIGVEVAELDSLRHSKEPRGGGSQATQEEREALGSTRRRRAEARRGERPGSSGPSDDELDRIAAARLGSQQRIQAANAETFEANAKKKPKGRGKSAEEREREKALEEARKQAKEELGEEFRRIGGRFGATEAGIAQAIESAAKSFAGGGNTAAARKSGLGTIGRLTDTKNIERQAKTDPLSALFGVENLPDVSPADISQDRAPDVLTATINNTFTIEQKFEIDGAARPDLIPDQVTDAVRSLFADEIEQQSKYVKVSFAR
jgi:hypothetical protein